MAPKRLCLMVLLVAAALAGDPRSIIAADPLVDGWIDQLDSDQFEVRESATQQLILAGPPAVAALTKAAQSSNAEVTWRAVHALSEIAVAGDFDKVNIAEDSLAQLRKSANPSAAIRAAAILESLPESRQSRAIAMLQSIGGSIDATGTQLHLDGKWQGKDSGLRYVRHVPALRNVQIEPDADVSEEGIKKLRSSLPEQVRITQFGSAFLGVGSASNEGSTGMMVLTVQPDSPAAKADLKVNDVITRIDDVTINGFDDLVAVIRKKKVGQEITITYSRPDPDTGDMKDGKTKATLGPRNATSR